MAGVAHSQIHLRFAWQAWHLIMALGGALGLVLGARHTAALCVAGVALGDIYVRFTWQAWHVVAQSHIHIRFAWQAWHLWHWVARLGPF